MTIHTTTVRHRPCPITGDTDVTVLRRQDFILPDNTPLPNSYAVVWSERAAFAYADTPASQAEYDAYYKSLSKYADHTTATGGGASLTDSRRLMDAARRIGKVADDRGARIVDVGCATGGLLGALQKLGFTNLMGVDPSPACVANVRNTYSIQAHAGGIFDLPGEAHRARLYLLSHVLEHIRDLKRGVSEIVAAAGRDGLIYIEVPDAARYRDYLVSPFQDFNSEHINHFSAASLSNLMKTVGWVSIAQGKETIEAAPGVGYPILFGFYRKSPTLARSELESDGYVYESLLNYIDMSKDKLVQMGRTLQRLCDEEIPIVVWGAGQLTFRLLSETILRKGNIQAFVDSNPQYRGRRLLGRRILDPERIRDFPDATILVSTTIHQKAVVNAIRQQLALSNPIVTLGEAAAPCG